MNAKPPITAVVRNRWCVRSDKAGVILPLVDGAGTALANFGLRVLAPWNAPAISSAGTPSYAWSSDAEGDYVELATDGGTDDSILLGTAAGADITFPRGTIVLRFTPKHTSTGAAQLVSLAATGSSAVANTLRITCNYATEGVTATKYNAAGTVGRYSNVLGAGELNKDHTIVVSWGEKGFHAWLDGVAMTVGEGTPSADTSAVVIADTKSARLGNLGNGAQSVGKKCWYRLFAWYDWQLSQRERDEHFCDPYAIVRPLCQTTTLRHQVLPSPGRYTATTAGFKVASPDTIAASGAGSLKAFRVFVDDRAIVRTDGSAIGTASVTFVNGEEATAKVATVTGLTAGQRYYALAQYADVDVTEDPILDASWHNFPGGVMQIPTQKGTGTAFKVASGGDQHASGIYTLGVDEIAWGDDTFTMSYSSGIEDWLHRWYEMSYDIFNGGADGILADIIVLGGDDTYAGDGAGTPESLIARWCAVEWLLVKTGMVVRVLGHHDGEGGEFMDGDQAAATVARKLYLCNPTYDTYPEGGENESVGWPAAGNSWIPAEDSVVGGVTIDAAYLNANVRIPGNQSPLETYGGFSWGGILRMLLMDCQRHCHIAYTVIDRTHNFYAYGPAQWEWYDRAKSRPRLAFCMTVSHFTPGGVWNDGDALKKYCRGSGAQYSPTRDANLASDPYWDGEAFSVGVNEESRLVRANQEAGDIILKFHDHIAGLVRKGNLNVVSAPTAASTLQFTPDSYGDYATQGADKRSEGVLFTARIAGYVEMYFDGTGETPTAAVRFRMTALRCTDQADSLTADDYYKSWQKFMPLVTGVGVGATSVTLPETPRRVFGVVAARHGDWASDPKGAWLPCNVSHWLEGAYQLYSETFTGDGAQPWSQPHSDAVIPIAAIDEENARVWAVPFTAGEFTIEGSGAEEAGLRRRTMRLSMRYRRNAVGNFLAQPALVADGTDQAVIVPKGRAPVFHPIGGSAELRDVPASADKMVLPEDDITPFGESDGQTLYVRADAGVTVEVAFN